MCNLAGDSVKYDTDFNYYERNMPPPHDPEEEKLISGDDEEEEGEDNKHLLEGPSPEGALCLMLVSRPIFELSNKLTCHICRN